MMSRPAACGAAPRRRSRRRPSATAGHQRERKNGVGGSVNKVALDPDHFYPRFFHQAIEQFMGAIEHGRDSLGGLLPQPLISRDDYRPDLVEYQLDVLGGGGT